MFMLELLGEGCHCPGREYCLEVLIPDLDFKFTLPLEAKKKKRQEKSYI